MKKALKRKILEYPAVFSPAIEGGYNVSFPDFPGCVTCGDNFEHAKAMAKEVLELWIEELESKKEELPTYLEKPIIDEIKVSVSA